MQNATALCEISTYVAKARQRRVWAAAKNISTLQNAVYGYGYGLWAVGCGLRVSETGIVGEEKMVLCP